MNDREPPMHHRQVCAFCGAYEVMSHEHVFPQWLAGVLPGNGDDDGGFLMERVPDSGERSSWKALVPDTKVWIGRACNNGWMSDLEGEVQTLLGKLIWPTRRRVTLNQAAQDQLARWIVKTTYMADLSNQTRIVPAAAFRDFYRTRQPPTLMRIWLSAYGGEHAIYSWRSAIAIGPPGDSGRVDGYVATIAVGCLVFQVAHVFDVEPTLPPAAEDVLLVPICPPQKRSQFWPAGWPGGQNAMDDDLLARFAVRFGGTPLKL